MKYQKTYLDAAHSHLVAVGADCPDTKVTAAAAHDDHRDDVPPDPYARVTDNRTPIQSDIEPDFDPNYKPYGAPPDSYKLALALKQIKSEDAQ